MREKATVDDIDAVLAAVRVAWVDAPFQRLGQLLLNATRDHNNETNKHILWNADEAELLRRLKPEDPNA